MPVHVFWPQFTGLFAFLCYLEQFFMCTGYQPLSDGHTVNISSQFVASLLYFTFLICHLMNRSYQCLWRVSYPSFLFCLVPCISSVKNLWEARLCFGKGHAGFHTGLLPGQNSASHLLSQGCLWGQLFISLSTHLSIHPLTPYSSSGTTLTCLPSHWPLQHLLPLP